MAQEIFELKTILKNISIKICARIECGVKQLLALVTSDGNIILHYTYGELPAVIKRIPWFTEPTKVIQAICYDPSATWLLAVCVDGSLFIVPALHLVDKKQKIDCKWSLNDITHFPRSKENKNAIPTSLVWWQTLECNQNAIVGYDNGTITLISLTDGRCLGTSEIPDKIVQLNICQDNALETVSLLINGHSQQWKLILEQNSVGYLWSSDIIHNEDLTRSKLYNLKQLSFDKFAILKQRLGRKENPNDTLCNSESNYGVPEMLPSICNTYFAPQYAKNRYLFSAFYKPTNLLTVHAVDIESAPLYVHKLTNDTNLVLLTDRLIFTVNDCLNEVSVISSQLSECRMDGETEFNKDALIAQFKICDEKVLQLFKLSDIYSTNLKYRKHEKTDNYELPKAISELEVQKPRVDTCIIVTNKAVYKIKTRCSPVEIFINLVNIDNNLEKAEKFAYVFGLNMQQLLEGCGDLMISQGYFHSGIILYKQAKVHLLKRVLKLAIASDCRTLLKFVHLCLSASKIDMSIATKIHLGNLAVMAYTESILRYTNQNRLNYIKDFTNFLRFEEFYDQILAVNVACQAGHWNIVTVLAKCRGLQPEVIVAIGQILQSARAPKPIDSEFLNALSEPSLTQSLLIYYQSGQIIFKYIRTHIEIFSSEILYRFAIQLDPSQPCVSPLVNRCRLKLNNESSNNYIEADDFDKADDILVAVKDFIETYILVLIYLINRTACTRFSIDLLNRVDNLKEKEVKDHCTKLPVMQLLSCGYEHAGIIRNSNLYMMGVSAAGCLGFGPLLTQSSPPKIVQTLSELKLKVLSVSCGRKHTLVLTDYGVYSWGSNNYGQLGLGSLLQETSYPQIIDYLSFHIITQIAAGQYHSIALTSSGQVYTWGWGIHGQLGHGNCINLFYPKLLVFDEPIIQIAAGHAHSLVLTESGKLFGFGSDVFGQLGESPQNATKSTIPLRISVLPDMNIPLDKITTSYFYSMAVRKDQEVYVWGANPQEVRIHQSKILQGDKIVPNGSESWRSSTKIFSNESSKPIEQIAIGFRHSALLCQGNILLKKSRDEAMSPPKIDRDKFPSLSQKFLAVSCGFDYTMALDHSGKLLAWGSSMIAQTLLGKSFDDDHNNKEKIIICKNTRRIVKFPNNSSANSDYQPIEVPGLPSMKITFDPIEQDLLFGKNFTPYDIIKIENDKVNLIQNVMNNQHIDQLINNLPKYKFGQKTLHYVLESYHCFYDSDKIINICSNLKNFQAASKIALLNCHLGDSLNFQLQAFKILMSCSQLNFEQNKKFIDLDENEQNLENIQDINGIMNKSNSSTYILSQSSSLDSIQQWGDDLEHQGGCESPCEISDKDFRYSLNHYVQSVKPLDLVEENLLKTTESFNYDYIADEETRMIVTSASKLIEFYLNKISISENHILMQNALMKCIEFWLSVNLPIPILENILLKNLDKYFYPLSILLFCKNYNEIEETVFDKQIENISSKGFFKEFSTKFCLKLCAMVLGESNKT